MQSVLLDYMDWIFINIDFSFWNLSMFCGKIWQVWFWCSFITITFDFLLSSSFYNAQFGLFPPGALGKRTRFQQSDVSQLFLKVERIGDDLAENEHPASIQQLEKLPKACKILYDFLICPIILLSSHYRLTSVTPTSHNKHETIGRPACMGRTGCFPTAVKVDNYTVTSL